VRWGRWTAERGKTRKRAKTKVKEEEKGGVRDEGLSLLLSKAAAATSNLTNEAESLTL
jgi:hypothetical protein